MVKFWDMDSVYLLTTIDADGALPASPCIRFNKDGTLLAVSTNENGVKILANADGVRQLRSAENRPFDASRVASAAASDNECIPSWKCSSWSKSCGSKYFCSYHVGDEPTTEAW